MRNGAQWWLAGVLLFQAYGWVPAAAAERIRVERPSVDRHQFRQHRGGGGHQHRFQRSGEGRIAQSRICINCEGENPNPEGPAPCGVDCGRGPNNRPDAGYVRVVQRIGRDAAREAFIGRSVPLTATKPEKRAYMKALQKSANGNVRSSMERAYVEPAYRGYGIEAGKQTSGRQAAKLIRTWNRGRREAGLGKPANITARNGRF